MKKPTIDNSKPLAVKTQVSKTSEVRTQNSKPSAVKTLNSKNSEVRMQVSKTSAVKTQISKTSEVKSQISKTSAVKTQNSKISAAKTQVSKKFYGYISERVAETCRLLPDVATTGREVMAIIDSYISGHKVNPEDFGLEIRLIFTLLRPEIDRALSRSANARHRAAQRRKDAERKEALFIENLRAMCHTAAAGKDCMKTAEPEGLTDSSPVVSPNRRQRRRELREEKRAMRQRIKRIW